MKRISDKKRQDDSENEPFLEQYRNEFPKCQCGEGCCQPGDHIHEIAGGSHRAKARKSRACILHLSHFCHRKIQGEEYSKGLARKLVSDPCGFSLQEFVGVIGRAPTAITMPEVTQWLEVRRCEY